MKKPIQVFGFRISNVTDDSIDVFIDGDIVDGSTQEIMKNWFGDNTSTSYKSFRNEIDKHKKVKTYNIYVNSPGGHVGDALAIHDFLRDLQTQGKVVNTIGRGIVASAATFVLLAGAEPEMSENSWFMMHDVSGLAFGKVDEVENQARTMRKFNDKVRDLYAQKTGSRKEDISKMMNAETWLTAQEAKDKGFISKVSGEAKFTNNISNDIWDMYDYMDNRALVAYNNHVEVPTPQSLTQQMADMKNFLAQFAKDITNAIKGVKPTAETTNEQLVNMIAEAVGNSFTSFSEQFENSVTEVIKAQVTDQMKNFKPEVEIPEVKIGEQTLEQKFTEIEERLDQQDEDIANKIGNPTQARTVKATMKPIGSFS